MIFDQLHKHLNKTAVFSHEDTKKVLSFLSPFELKKGMFLLQSGEVCKYLAYIFKGCIEYYFLDDKGEKHIVYFAAEDWWIGDTGSFFSRQPSIYYIEALEDTLLYTASFEKFNALIAEVKPYSEYFKIRTSVGYTATAKRFTDSKSMSAEERYLQFFSAHAF